MTASENRLAGRTALRGNWGMSVLVSLVAGLLGATSNSSGGASSTASSVGSNTGYESSITQSMGIDIPVWVWGFLATVGTVMLLYGLVVLILGGAVDLGQKQYFISLHTKDRPVEFKTLFSKFSIFGKAFVMNLLVGIFVALWMFAGMIPAIILGILLYFVNESLLILLPLLLIAGTIPGIIASYRYAMAPYILTQNPGMSATDAITRSKELMRGNKWRFFCMHFSFIGWAILCLFTLGLGYLVLRPYISAAEAHFYLTLPGSQPPMGYMPGPGYMPPGGPMQSPPTEMNYTAGGPMQPPPQGMNYNAGAPAPPTQGMNYTGAPVPPPQGVNYNAGAPNAGAPAQPTVYVPTPQPTVAAQENPTGQPGFAPPAAQPPAAAPDTDAGRPTE